MTVKSAVVTVALVGLSYYWFNFIKSGPIMISNNLVAFEGKTVLITGGNSGIGKLTAIELAKKGARVIIASRNITKSLEARAEIISESQNHNVVAFKLNLADFESVKSFAKDFHETENYLDLLINNAGAIDVAGRTGAGINKLFATNYMGHFLLTNLLLEKMKLQSIKRPVRIINLSSETYKLVSYSKKALYSNPKSLYEILKTYAASKLATIYFTSELHKRLRGHNITVFAVHPGFVITEHGRKFSPLIRFFLDWILRPLFFRDPFYGIQTILYCAMDDQVTSFSGGYFKDCQQSELYSHATDPSVGQTIWKESLKVTGLNVA